LEATDLEYDTMGIGEGMPMPALYADAVGRPRDRVPAGTAEDKYLLLRRPLIGRMGFERRSRRVLRPLRWLAQALDPGCRQADHAIPPWAGFT
jgi:hypothetical protein